MTAAPSVTTVLDRPVDHPRATATLVVAFAADPVMRWLYPTAASYLHHFPELVAVFGGEAFSAGTADHARPDIGVALWVSPGVPSDEERAVELLERTIDAERHATAFAFFAQVEEHHPAEPHWYLPFIGVDPRFQGQGHGSALLRIGLARADRDGLPAYLEASTPRNRDLYLRHGFEVVGEVSAGDSPPLWPMLRPAAPR